MSTKMKREIVCPKCSANNIFEMAVGITSTQNPELKNQILNENLFDHACAECGYNSQLAYPLVYSDPAKDYIIALTPVAGTANTISTLPEIEHVTKRRVKSLAELKEKIMIFDAELDDMAIELVKNALSIMIKQSREVEKIKVYFSKVDSDGNYEFAVFIDGKKEAEYQSTKQEVYDQCVEVAKVMNFTEADEFMRVGPTLADELLTKFRNGN